MAKKISFYIGLWILIVMIASYFIKINTDSGFNFMVEERILGILIFHNPFILGLYVLVAVVLMVNGNKSQKRL